MPILARRAAHLEHVVDARDGEDEDADIDEAEGGAELAARGPGKPDCKPYAGERGEEGKHDHHRARDVDDDVIPAEVSCTAAV